MGLSKRLYSRGEQLADRYLHRTAIVSAVLAVLALLSVTLRSGDPLLAIGVGIYGIGLVAMLVCSALSNHNLGDRSPRAELLERIDHAAILFMIAATYTPFTVKAFDYAWGFGLLGFVWAVALTGIAVKLSPRGRRRYGLSIALYLILGWSVLPVLDPLMAVLSLPTFILLAVGGGLYSVGVLFYLWARLPYHTVVWHAFVLLAAGCHYAAVMTVVVLPGPL